MQLCNFKLLHLGKLEFTRLGRFGNFYARSYHVGCRSKGAFTGNASRAAVNHEPEMDLTRCQVRAGRRAAIINNHTIPEYVATPQKDRGYTRSSVVVHAVERQFTYLLGDFSLYFQRSRSTGVYCSARESRAHKSRSDPPPDLLTYSCIGYFAPTKPHA